MIDYINYQSIDLKEYEKCKKYLNGDWWYSLRPNHKRIFEDCIDVYNKNINRYVEIFKLKDLHLNSRSLTTLKPLEFCVNLEYLDCTNNRLTTLEGLERCINLTHLNCAYNNITTLKHIKNCYKLRYLDIGNLGKVCLLEDINELLFFPELKTFIIYMPFPRNNINQKLVEKIKNLLPKNCKFLISDKVTL